MGKDRFSEQERVIEVGDARVAYHDTGEGEPLQLLRLTLISGSAVHDASVAYARAVARLRQGKPRRPAPAGQDQEVSQGAARLGEQSGRDRSVACPATLRSPHPVDLGQG